MINEEKTYEIFGYYSKDVTSHKKVIAHCPSCNSDRTLEKHNAIKSKKCNQCQRTDHCKKIAKVNRIGRKHSEETKKKIGLSNLISHPKGKDNSLFGIKKSEEFKEKIRESNKSRVWTDESRKKLSEKHKGKKLSETHKKKIGRSGKLNHRYGKRAIHGKGDFFIKKDGSKIWMRSSWEIKIAKYLDSKDYVWIYEPSVFPIKYIINNVCKEGTFNPDFFIQNLNEYWEIKGWWRDDAKPKYEAFISQYKQLNVKLLMKNELKALDLL